MILEAFSNLNNSVINNSKTIQTVSPADFLHYCSVQLTSGWEEDDETAPVTY